MVEEMRDYMREIMAEWEEIEDSIWGLVADSVLDPEEWTEGLFEHGWRLLEVDWYGSRATGLVWARVVKWIESEDGVRWWRNVELDLVHAMDRDERS